MYYEAWKMTYKVEQEVSNHNQIVKHKRKLNMRKKSEQTNKL